MSPNTPTTIVPVVVIRAAVISGGSEVTRAGARTDVGCEEAITSVSVGASDVFCGATLVIVAEVSNVLSNAVLINAVMLTVGFASCGEKNEFLFTK